MKRTSLFPIILLLALGTVTGCSSVHTADTAVPPQQITDTSDGGGDRYVLVEPEEVLEEELSALNQTGTWDDGQLKSPAKAKPDIVFDFPITMNKQVDFYLDIFQNRQRKYFKR
ncbi:MAG TPA: hypothetical protein ENK96_01445, partial [Desulfobulbaceae bacterium]|nr:hypothetical protein [Desulfobulbaceae bacterium]